MKYVVGPIAFLLAAATSAALTFVMTPVPDPPLPPPASFAPVCQTAPAPTPLCAPVTTAPALDVTQFTLDRGRKTLIASLRLEPVARASGSTRVWVAFHVFQPGRSGSVLSTDPIAVDFPAGAGTVSVSAAAPWVGSSRDPGAGYFARVSVWSHEPSRDEYPTVNVNELAEAVPVVVYGAR